MADLRDAWRAYHQGNYERAFRMFESISTTGGMVGKAMSLVALGRSDEAITLVDHRLQSSPSARLEALLADIKGRQGKRAKAQRILEGVTERLPEEGFYRTLLGEQRIRQGKWEDGTKQFVAGLETGDSRAFPHVRRVITDMIDAVAARRIPQRDAAKFINRIDYSVANKTDEMTSFFAKARRTLNSNRRMEREKLRQPWSIDVDDTASSTTGTSPSSAPSPQTSPPTNRPPAPSNTGRPPDSNRQTPPSSASSPPSSASSPPASDSSAPGSSTSRSERRKKKMQKRLAERPEESKPEDEPMIEAKRKDMAAVMEDERRRNEQLQDLTEDVQPPTWPSELEEPIDTIEPIGFSRDTILKGSNDINTANFRITGGDIGVEITLERCMHNLIAAALAVKPTTLPTTLESIPRLELNLLDEFLDEMPQLVDLYSNETEVERPKVLGVGKFIGECIIQSYGGVWNHELPARDSVIHIGDHVIDPIGLATKFLDSDDFDAVDLQTLISEAEHAVSTSTAMATFADYVDPTSGLGDDALASSLAELWVGYRFSFPDTAVQNIASSIEVSEATPDYVVFFIDSQYAPAPLVTEHDGTTDSDGRVAMAYVRETGEFLVLASKKHFCRLLDVADLTISRQHAATVADWTQRWFRPGWSIMKDRETTEKWRQHYDTSELSPPSMKKNDRGAVLRLDALDTGPKARQLQIAYRTGEVPSWKLSLS